MTRLLRYLVACTALVLMSEAAAAQAGPIELNESATVVPDTIRLDRGQLLFDDLRDAYSLSAQPWRYREGDNMSWAAQGLDDSDWGTAFTFDRRDRSSQTDFKGIVWFRLHLIVDSSLVGVPLGLMVSQDGASELYLDGRMLYAFGTVANSISEEEPQIRGFQEPEAIQFDRAGHHVIAVRYSNLHHRITTSWGGFTGVNLTLGEHQSLRDAHAELFLNRSRHQSVFTAVALSFALLHLLMYLFHPTARENLYYSLLAFALAGIVYFPAQTNITTEIWSLAVYIYLFKLFLCATCVFSILVTYKFFYDEIPGRFKYWAIAGALFFLLSWWLPMLAVFAFAMLSLGEAFRVVASAVLSRRRMSWVVAVGFLAFILTSSIQMLPEFLPSLQEHGTIQAGYPIYMWGILALMLSSTVYLAMDFARINRNLKQKVTEIRELSEHSLAQERRARQQEMERKLLEADLEKQRVELEKTAELRKAHAELSIANRNLQETQSQLVQSEKMASLGMLVAGIAHELNTPIGAVYSMHNTLARAIDNVQQTLTQTEVGEPQKAAVLDKNFSVINDANRVIQNGAERVATIVKRLRSFARLDEADMQRADIHVGIEDTLMLIHHEIKHDIEVVRDYGDLPDVSCYPGQLNQVFLNVLNNARQAMSGQGTIRISTRRDGEYVEIKISDTGKGISPDNLKKIFDPGFTTKGVGVGTGLGLAICYQIVQEHRGTIAASSELSKGTTITIRLPLNLDQQVNEKHKE